MKLLFVVNVDWFFCSHRLPVAIGALRHGYEVHVATTFTSSERRELLSGYGFQLHDLNIDRSGKSFFGFFVNFLRIYKIIRLLKPDIVHLVTLQPILLGGLACRVARAPRVVFAISGLGHVFLARSMLSRIRRFLVECLYRLALSVKCRAVVFQNPQDQLKMSGLCSILPSEAFLIPGSGVDLKVFTYSPLSESRPLVLMASRLLATKGVREFVNASKILKNRVVSARFQLVGDPDFSNPAAISLDELSHWRDLDCVEILGNRLDLNKLMSEAHIICLPSYREGLPKVLCEAAASGRAVITTDVPGCRDAIESGVTGLMVPSQDSLALSDAIENLLLNLDLAAKMGIAGRRRAESLFDVNVIVKRHLDIYSSLLLNS